MGYLVTYGSSELYRPGDMDRTMHGAKLAMKTDAVSTFRFTIPPTHPLCSTIALHDFANPVRVEFDGELIFCGFVTGISETINRELEVSCDSDLAMLSWVHVRIEDHPKGNGNRRVYTGRKLFADLISYYNNLVPSARRFTIGHNIGASDVGYFDSVANATVVDAAASTPTGILDLLSKAILDPYGCMLRVWYSNGTRYIGLYTSPPTTSTQRIEFGENMTELVAEALTSEMYTGCLPTGGSRRDYTMTGAKKLEITSVHPSQSQGVLNVRSLTGSTIAVDQGDVLVIGDGEYQFQSDNNIKTTETVVVVEGTIGETLPVGTVGYWLSRNATYTQSSLTLGRLDDGTYQTDYTKVGDIVYDTAAVARYGLKTFTFSDSDTMYAADLLSKAIAELAQKVGPTYTLDVDGVDMALYMPGYNHLIAGQKVRVVSVPHGIDTTMVVSAADLDLDNPGATSYTLGTMPRTATAGIRAARTDTTDVRDMLVFDINDVITNADIMGLQ